MSINSNDDVNIQDPKAGQVLKYTANGWTNASVSSTSSNACGDLEGYARKDLPETITEPWIWEVDNDQCGIKVRNEPFDGQETDLCANKITIENYNGKGELKVFDGGNTRLRSLTGELSFSDSSVNGVTLSDLMSCCSSGSEGTSVSGSGRPTLINFPTPGTVTLQQGMFAASSDQRSDFIGIFNSTEAESITMPAGTDAAIVFVTYGIQMLPWSGVTSYTQGYINVAYRLNTFCTKDFSWSPGGTNDVFQFGTKLRGEMISWSDASSIGGGNEQLRRSRTSGISHRPNFMQRLYFTESTEASPTTFSFSPNVDVARMRACEADIGSGKVLIIPYKIADGDPFPRLLSDEDQFIDDGATEDEFDALTASHDLKALMNYYTTAISETINYDTGLDPNAVTVLEGALNDIFDLKRDTTADIQYYYNRLATIKDLVVPYVGFKFAFEPTTTKASF